jgi:signal transduction histidine kinase
MSELVHDIVARMAADASRAGCRIEVLAPAPVVGTWDRPSIDQVVTNLLSNAIKFGHGEPIEVRVEKLVGAARVRVRDYGLGVAEADRERIFERFERGVSERAFGGLGLGLWIARQIVTAHRGRIGILPVEGPGTEFFVELPEVAGG